MRPVRKSSMQRLLLGLMLLLLVVPLPASLAQDDTLPLEPPAPVDDNAVTPAPVDDGSTIGLPGEEGPAAPQDTVIFFDDFETGLDKWSASPGVVRETDDAGNNAAVLVAGETLVPPLPLALDRFELVVWFNLLADDAALSLDLSGLVVQAGAAGLSVSADGAVLAEAAQAAAAGTWQMLTLVADGGVLNASLNGSPALSATPANGLTLTSLTLSASGAGLRLDDVLLKALADSADSFDSPTLPEPVGDLSYSPDRVFGPLTEVLDLYAAGNTDAALAKAAERFMHIDNRGRVAVQLWAAPGFTAQDLAALVEAEGGRIEDLTVTGISLRARLPLAAIASISQTGVGSLYPQDRVGYADIDTTQVSAALRSVQPAPVGGAATEGFDIAGAQSWHLGGVTGGSLGGAIRVAIMAPGFGTNSSPNANTLGNLTCVRQSGGSLILETGSFAATDPVVGRNMAEVLCDMAPQSQVFLYKVTSAAGLAQAINAAATTNNVDVIVIGLDLTAAISPGDGTLGITDPGNDPYAAINTATNNGAVVVAAAGNSGNSYATVNFTGSPITFTGAASPGDIIAFSWNGWGGPSNTLSMSTTFGNATPIGPRPGGQVVIPSCTVNAQGLCDFSATINGAGTFTVQVQVTGTRSTLVPGGGITPLAGAGSLARPADSPNAIAVGAVCADNEASYPLAVYSGRGPVYAAGGVVPAALVPPLGADAVKPDVVGPANVSTAQSGSGNCNDLTVGFHGTESSAAHVAGMVALLISNRDSSGFGIFAASNNQVFNAARDYLRTHAADMPFAAPDGFDNIHGAGLAVLGSPDFNYSAFFNAPSPNVPNTPVGCSFATNTVFAGPFNLDETPDGSLGRPIPSLPYAIQLASAVPGGGCVIALPGEYATPMQIFGLANPVQVFGYSTLTSVNPLGDSIVRVQNTLVGELIDSFAYVPAGLYIGSSTPRVTEESADAAFTFSGFTFTRGALFDSSVIQSQGAVTVNESGNATIDNNRFVNYDLNGTLIEVINGSVNIGVTNNTISQNNNSGGGTVTLINVDESGTPAGRIRIQRNSFEDNLSLSGSWNLGGLPLDSNGFSDRSMGWVPLVRTIDSYTDIVSNRFVGNQAETIIAAVTRLSGEGTDQGSVEPAEETRILGNVFVNNITTTEEQFSNSGPLVHLFNMPRIFFINNTVAHNRISVDSTNLFESSGTYGYILGRGDEVDAGGGSAVNDGSLTSVQARWDIHNNFIYDNFAGAGLAGDMEFSGVQCNRVGYDGFSNGGAFFANGAQHNWISRTGPDPRESSSALGECLGSFVTDPDSLDNDPYPREVVILNETLDTWEWGALLPGSTPLISGASGSVTLTSPNFYSLIGSETQPTIDGIDQAWENINWPAPLPATYLDSFFAGEDARGNNRREDGDAVAPAIVDLGAFELSPLIVTNPIFVTATEDAPLVQTSVSIPSIVEGGIPPYTYEIVTYPQYFGTHCGPAFANPEVRGINIVDLPGEANDAIQYCPPQDLYTHIGGVPFNTTDTSYNPTGTDFSFRITDDSGQQRSPIVDVTLNAVDDSALTTSIGDENPTGDLFARSVGVGRGTNANRVRLRPFVDFSGRFSFSERNNAVEPALQSQTDYGYSYSLPTLVADPDNLNPEILVNALSWVGGALGEERGEIGFNLSGAAATTESRARFQYTVTDVNGNGVTNFIDVRAVIPATDFALLTPAAQAIVTESTPLTTFTWQVSQKTVSGVQSPVDFYNFRLTRTSVIDVDVLTFEGLTSVAGDGDRLACTDTTCTLFLNPTDIQVLAQGTYNWTVDAIFEGLETTATNAPSNFTVTDGEELVLNGGFEATPGNVQIATNWNLAFGQNDRRVCNKIDRPGGLPDKIVANQGDCAYKLTGNPGLNTRVNQRFNTDTLEAFANDTLTLSYYVTGRNINNVGGTGARVRIRIKYTNGSKQNIAVPIPNGTYDYQFVTSGEVPITGTVDTMRVQLQANNSAGRAFIDDVSVILRRNLAFELLGPLNNSVVYMSPGRIPFNQFTWQASGKAATYNFELTQNGAPVFSTTGLTAALDTDPLYCVLDVCRYQVEVGTNPGQVNILSSGEYEWTVTSVAGVVPPQPFRFTVVATGEELLNDGGFDIDVNADRLPDTWIGSGLDGDRLNCNRIGLGTRDKIFSYQGSCVMQFRGAPNGAVSRLQQVLRPTGLTSADTLNLSAVVWGRGVVAGGLVQVRVFYTDGTRSTHNLAIPNGRYEFTQIALNNIPLQGTVDRIRVRVQYSGTSGRVRVDNVSVYRN